jgi:hypothetical protein
MSHRAKRRKGARGAAMVEAAFMLPMFVLLWYVALYAHNMNSKQIGFNLQTRSDAWAYAMANCGGGSGSGPAVTVMPQFQQQPSFNYSGQSTPSFSNIVSGGGGGAASYMSAIGGVLSSFPFFTDPNGEQSTQQTQVSFRMPQTYGGDMSTGTTPVGSKMTLFCNEKPQTGDIKNVIGDIFNAIFGMLQAVMKLPV